MPIPQLLALSPLVLPSVKEVARALGQAHPS